MRGRETESDSIRGVDALQQKDRQQYRVVTHQGADKNLFRAICTGFAICSAAAKITLFVHHRLEYSRLGANILSSWAAGCMLSRKLSTGLFQRPPLPPFSVMQASSKKLPLRDAVESVGAQVSCRDPSPS